MTWMPAATVAEALGVDAATVAAMVADGQLSAFVDADGLRWIDADDVREAMPRPEPASRPARVRRPIVSTSEPEEDVVGCDETTVDVESAAPAPIPSPPVDDDEVSAAEELAGIRSPWERVRLGTAVLTALQREVDELAAVVAEAFGELKALGHGAAEVAAHLGMELADLPAQARRAVDEPGRPGAAPARPTASPAADSSLSDPSPSDPSPSDVPAPDSSPSDVPASGRPVVRWSDALVPPAGIDGEDEVDDADGLGHAEEVELDGEPEQAEAGGVHAEAADASDVPESTDASDGSCRAGEGFGLGTLLDAGRSVVAEVGRTVVTEMGTVVTEVVRVPRALLRRLGIG